MMLREAIAAFHSPPKSCSLSLAGLLLLSRSILEGPPRPPRPAWFPLPGGGLTKAKSTEIVWSSSLTPFAPSMAARASVSVGYSMRT